MESGNGDESIRENPLVEEILQGQVVGQLRVEGHIVQPVVCLFRCQTVEQVRVLRLDTQIHLLAYLDVLLLDWLDCVVLLDAVREERQVTVGDCD